MSHSVFVLYLNRILFLLMSHSVFVLFYCLILSPFFRGRCKILICLYSLLFLILSFSFTNVSFCLCSLLMSALPNDFSHIYFSWSLHSTTIQHSTQPCLGNFSIFISPQNLHVFGKGRDGTGLLCENSECRQRG